MSEFIQSIEAWLQTSLGLGPGRASDILLTVVFWGVLAVARFAFMHTIERRVPELQRRYVVQKTLNYVLGFIFFGTTVIIWFGGLSGWTAYLGLVSAGLAIALQDPLVNLVGWIFISVRKPFVVGDRVQIGDHRGDVIDLRLFQFSLIEIGVMVTFESDWRRAKELLAEIATRHSAIHDERAAEEVRQAGRKYMIFFQHLTPIVWTSVADSGVVLTQGKQIAGVPPRPRSGKTS